MDLTDTIKGLRVGKSFKVESDSDRKEALKIAGILGRRVATHKIKTKQGPAFLIIRLPNL